MKQCYVCYAPAVGEMRWFAKDNPGKQFQPDHEYTKCFKCAKASIVTGNPAWFVRFQRFGQNHIWDFQHFEKKKK